FQLDSDLDSETDAPRISAESAPEQQEVAPSDLAEVKKSADSEDSPVLEDALAADSEDLTLGLDLDLETEATEAAESEEALSASNDLELSDLEDILEEDQEAGSEKSSATVTEEEDFELDFDLETETAESDAEQAEALSAGESLDELDFSDLEKMLEGEEAPVSEDTAEGSGEELDLDLDLDFASEEETPEITASESEAQVELDFTDLESMLEEDNAAEGENGLAEVSEELELDLDVGEVEAKAEAAEDESGEMADDDFLDIEEMLEASGASSSEEEGDAPGTGPDLALETEASADEAAMAKSDLELDFELDEDAKMPEEPATASATADDELDFKLLETDPTESPQDQAHQTAVQGEEALAATNEMGAISDDFATEEFTDIQEVTGATDVAEAPVEEVVKPTKSRRPLKAVLVVVILALLGVGVIVVPPNLGINIPFISDIRIPYLSDVDLKGIPWLGNLIKSKNEDLAGNLKITPLERTIKGEFVNNAQLGRLFVVKGQVRNEYDHPRSFIRITGKLFKKGKALASTSTVYCGNVLASTDLAQMDLASMNKRLQNRFGDQRSNFKVKTDKAIPFMIVFNNLPENLDEFTVEIAGSSAAKAK
ncbi:MAG: DUF3426 domain-containing protein, partial [Desulfobacterales bacterium]